jgi:hypothetical protein
MRCGEDVQALEDRINQFLAKHPNAHSFKVAQSMTVPPTGEIDAVLLTLFYRELPERKS